MKLVRWSKVVHQTQNSRSDHKTGGVDQLFLVHSDKSAGQRHGSPGPPLRGVLGEPPQCPPTPLGGAEEPDDLPDREPTDEELWLDDIARRVEADARPLVVAAWLELLRRALAADEDEGEPT